MNNDAVFVIGASGHGKSLISLLRACGFQVSAIFDDNPRYWGANVLGVPVLGAAREDLVGMHRLGMIGIGDNGLRRDQAEKLSGVEWLTLIYPGAYVTPTARIGAGSVIFPGAIVGTDVIVGKHAIVSANCTVGHDTEVGDYAQLAPGVQVAGAVKIGEGAMLGIGSSVVPERVVGDWSVVGAGSTVVRDVPPHAIVFGVPARVR